MLRTIYFIARYILFNNYFVMFRILKSHLIVGGFIDLTLLIESISCLSYENKMAVHVVGRYPLT